MTVRRKNVRVRLGIGLIRKYPPWNGGHSVHTSNVPFVNKVSYYSQREGTLLSTFWSQIHCVTDIKQCCKMNVPNHWQFDCLFQKFRITIKKTVGSPHKGPVLPEAFPFQDAILLSEGRFNIKIRSYAPVTSHFRAPYGLFPGCSRAILCKNHSTPYGSSATTNELCLPVRGPWSFKSLMQAL